MNISRIRYVILIIACALFTTASSHAAFLRIYNQSDKVLKVIRRNPWAPFQDVENTIIWPGQSNHLSTGLQPIKLIEFLEPANAAMTAWKKTALMNPHIMIADASSQVFYTSPTNIRLQNIASKLEAGLEGIFVSLLSPVIALTHELIKELVEKPEPTVIPINSINPNAR